MLNRLLYIKASTMGKDTICNDLHPVYSKIITFEAS